MVIGQGGTSVPRPAAPHSAAGMGTRRRVHAPPHALSELEAADGQPLIVLSSIDPTRQKRQQITDPAAAPPKLCRTHSILSCHQS